MNTMGRQPKQLSFTDHRRHTGWGGPREGAGRKPASRRPPVHHVRRDPVPGHAPAHVTLRVRREVPSLRCRRFLRVFRASLRKGCERGEFRVVHYSVQRDHVHLLVEAAGKDAMGRGMKSVAPRLAKAVNRVFGRSGAALHGCYHIRLLRTAEGGVQCARLRAAQHAQALEAGPRVCAAGEDRCGVVGALVRWVETARARSRAARGSGGCAAAHLAVAGWVAAVWADSSAQRITSR
jgi:REP element-mobilizing transposase RayT